MRHVYTHIWILLVVLGFVEASLVFGQSPAKNVIFFFRDGMGTSTGDHSTYYISKGHQVGDRWEEETLNFKAFPNVDMHKVDTSRIHAFIDVLNIHFTNPH